MPAVEVGHAFTAGRGHAVGVTEVDQRVALACSQVFEAVSNFSELVKFFHVLQNLLLYRIDK